MTYQIMSKEAISSILDVFSGADGGVDFVKLRFFVEDLACKADKGDKDAARILYVVFNFQKLIHFVSKQS